MLTIMCARAMSWPLSQPYQACLAGRTNHILDNAFLVTIKDMGNSINVSALNSSCYRKPMDMENLYGIPLVENITCNGPKLNVKQCKRVNEVVKIAHKAV